MVEIGYSIERGVFLVVFSILGILSVLQALTEFLSPKREVWGTVKWASHRLGTAGILLQLLATIDYSEVFGIWTPSNRLDYFFTYNGTACIVALAASSAFSILRSDSMIIKEKPSIMISVGYTVACAAVFIVSFAVPAYAVAVGSYTVPRAWFLLTTAFAFLYCGIGFLVSAARLISRLSALSKQISPSMDIKKTNDAIRALKLFSGTLVFIDVVAVVYLLYAASFAVTHFTQPDPENYDPTSTLFIVLQVLGYSLAVSFTWNPLSTLRQKAPEFVDSPPVTPRAKSLTVSNLGNKNSKNSKNKNAGGPATPPSPQNRNISDKTNDSPNSGDAGSGDPIHKTRANSDSEQVELVIRPASGGGHGNVHFDFANAPHGDNEMKTAERLVAAAHNGDNNNNNNHPAVADDNTRLSNASTSVSGASSSSAVSHSAAQQHDNYNYSSNNNNMHVHLRREDSDGHIDGVEASTSRSEMDVPVVITNHR